MYGQTWNLEENWLTFNSKKQASSPEGKLKKECLPEMNSLNDLSGIIAHFNLKPKIVFRRVVKRKWIETNYPFIKILKHCANHTQWKKWMEESQF